MISSILSIYTLEMRAGTEPSMPSSSETFSTRQGKAKGRVGHREKIHAADFSIRSEDVKALSLSKSKWEKGETPGGRQASTAVDREWNSFLEK